MSSSLVRIEPPKIGVYIVQGEMLLVVTAMRRSSRWTSHLPQVGMHENTGGMTRIREPILAKIVASEVEGIQIDSCKRN